MCLLCFRFGRKKAIVTLVTGSAVSGIALAFATTYETYAFLRFLTGTFGISTIVAIYTYGMFFVKMNEYLD